MINYPVRRALYEKYIVHTKRLAVAFLLLGLSGILFPGLFGLTVAVFVGWMMFFSGIFAGYVTFRNDRKSLLGWFKSILLTVTGILMISRPFTGVSALAVLVAVYLFTDSAVNFMLAFALRPPVHKIWPVVNGLVSAVLAVIFVYYTPNPLASSWILGLYVGISLLFDAMMLWQLGKGAGKIVVEKMVVEE